MTSAQRVATRWVKASQQSPLGLLLGTYDKLVREATQKVRQGTARSDWMPLAAGVGYHLLGLSRIPSAQDRYYALLNDAWTGIDTSRGKGEDIAYKVWHFLPHHDQVLIAAFVVRLMDAVLDKRAAKVDRLLTSLLGNKVENYVVPTGDVSMRQTPETKVREWVGQWASAIQYWLPEAKKLGIEGVRVLIGRVAENANFHGLARSFPDQPNPPQGMASAISSDLQYDFGGVVAFAYGILMAMGQGTAAKWVVKAALEDSPELFAN